MFSRLIIFISILVLGTSVMAATPLGADEKMRREYGYPPKKQAWHFNIESTDQPSVYKFTMLGNAESYLGTGMFMSLPSRFREIGGVEEVDQNDRNLYYINSYLSSSQLEKALWKAFLSAATESFGKK